MEIRRLLEADWEAYRSIRLEALQVAPEAFAADLEEQSRLPPEHWAERLAGGENAFVLGAFEAGQIIGMAGFARERGQKLRHKGSVWGVYVTPAFRERGAARELLTALLGQVRSVEGLEQVLLSVEAGNLTARALYRKLGFQVFGREPRALKVGDRFLDEEHMVLFLAT